MVSTAASYGGIVRNNFFAMMDANVPPTTQGYAAGVVAQNACGLSVVHNTIISMAQPQDGSVSWEYSETVGGLQSGNLTTHGFNYGVGVSVTAENDYVTASGMNFVQSSTANLHLRLPASGIIDEAAVVDPALRSTDFDGQRRHGTRPDYGADEYVP
jgi:hypothetical protein